MTTNLDDAFWNDVFHGCAWAAYVELAVETGGPPDSEAVRIRAFRYYEEELAARPNRR